MGETVFEEIDWVPAGGHNFGWPTYQADSATGTGCPGVRGDDPIYFYDRTGYTAAAVIGGPVYHKPPSAIRGFPSFYEGEYFFSDFYTGGLRRLHRTGNNWNLATPVAGQPNTSDWGRGFDSVSDYAVGPDGSLWYCRQASYYRPNSGEIHSVAYAPETIPVDSIPQPASFLPPWPLPAGAAVHLAYVLPAPARTELVVYDITGRLVRRLLPPSVQDPSAYEIVWDGTDSRGRRVPGVYVARLTVDGRAIDHRILLLR